MTGKKNSSGFCGTELGEKPLYYGLVNGSFVFASELTAIAALPDFCGKINKDVLDLYLIHGYIPAPYSIYEGIYKLEPGKILRLEKPYRDWRIETYWSMAETAKKGQEQPFTGSRQEASEELERLFNGEHPRSDDGRRAAGSIFVSRNRQLYCRFPDAVDF